MSSENGSPAREGALPVLVIRGVIGGTLMGLANLVPGISGGTMLLAAGVYPGFIAGIAEVTTLRFRLRSLVLLAAIVGSAALGILLLAGTVKSLVVEHRWVMYSLFIGLTLGGVPLIWRMARPASGAVYGAAAAAFAVMCAMAFGSSGSGAAAASAFMLFVSGLAAASAMILPGVSGGYLLLLLGQYENILGTIDQLKLGLLGDPTAGTGFDLTLVIDALALVIPLGLGVAAGVVGVSNALKWLLERYEKATLGALLGLLLGAVVGLWPFQVGVEPEPGDVLKGRTVTVENRAEFEPDDWAVRRFDPSGGQVAAALALIAGGLLGTVAIGRLSGAGDDDDADADADA
ncbi:MAG: undecaprenyl phosphate translocase family protein [Myxococcota bacterium]